MKLIFKFLVLIIFISCSTTKRNDTKSVKQKYKEPDSVYVREHKIVPTAYKGFKYPYIHINGYNGFKISKSRFLKHKNLNELKYFHTYSSFYTRQVMFEKFGDWDNIISVKGHRTPFLIWKNVKLFKNSEKKYIVIAGGYECTTCKSDNDRIYASIFLLDENENDLLIDENSELAKKTINFFSEGIKNLTNSKKFYNKFWSLVK